MPIYLVYYFWLILFSAIILALERLFPWRREQEAVRDDLVQDLFWMVFNTQYVSWMLALLTVHTAAWFNAAFLHFQVPTPDSLRLISSWPLWQQFLVMFLLRDFLEWNIHRMLHLVPWLWRFHRLHHSIEQLDWASSFRAHWFEMVIYQTLIYVPLVVLGVDERVVFAIIVFSLLIQEITHANLSWDWGPLRYILNSPRFHAWHHVKEMHGRGGQNFGVTLAVWDWLFRTAYWPRGSVAPTNFGFEDMTHYPRGIWRRMWEPFFKEKRDANKSQSD